MAADPLNVNRIKLDQLMGINRNKEYAHLNESPPKSFTDARICHYYLAGYCPEHSLADLMNQESFLSPCKKIHLEAFRAQYNDSELHKDLVYEKELLCHLRELNDRFNQLFKNKEKNLKDVAGQSTKTLYKHIKQSEEAKAKANNLLKEAESFLALKDPAAGQRIVALCKQIETLLKLSETHEATARGKKEPSSLISAAAAKTRLCGVCLLKLAVTDTDERLAEHFSGKRHREMKRFFSKLKETEELFNGPECS